MLITANVFEKLPLPIEQNIAVYVKHKFNFPIEAVPKHQQKVSLKPSKISAQRSFALLYRKKSASYSLQNRYPR